ncbi:MAG: thymidylate kinase [Methanobacterium sp.]|nr:thymidylate kinase [Methanobacterium sp.]
MRFIIIDGLDGSGKDTHAKLIQKYYLAKGEKVIVRTHPSTDNIYGIKAKKALLGQGKINHIKASMYYAFDVLRSVHKYHGKSDTFIMVRYLMGVAYLPFPIAKILYMFFSKILPTSNYMFFLDVEPDELYKRLLKRSEHEMFENLYDLIKVRVKALKLAKDWHIINTGTTIEQAQLEINKILEC